MTDPSATRRALRLALRSRRADLDEDEQAAASMAVMARLARVPVLRSARLLAGFRAVRGELDIDAALILLDERGTEITIPRVAGEHLEFIRWHPQDQTVPGSFGIPEPLPGESVPVPRHDVILAPLVAFDSIGNRLGQGAGFYDRALARRVDFRPTVIGIAHSFQQVDAIPVEPWDIPLDAVVTEEGVTEFRPGSLDPPISPQTPPTN